MRICHYGFLANRCRRTKLTQIRTALAQGDHQTVHTETDDKTAGTCDGYPSPRCRIGSVRIIGFRAPLSFECG